MKFMGLRSYHRWIMVGIGLTAVGVVVGSGAFRDEPSVPTAESTPPEAIDPIERGLLSEFDGTMVEEASPNGKVIEIDLEAAPSKQHIVPEYETDVWAYSGQVPGPTLRIRLGETLKVNFKNSIPQATTIHWHGVRVPNAMDGVPGVTQPPIQPGEAFVYEFTPKDAGTFWFHPHPHHNGAEQLERGLYSALIVEEANPPAYDQDLVWVLDDWLLVEGAKIYDQFVTPRDLGHDGRWGNVPSVNGVYSPTFDVTPGERIRLRLVVAANGRVFRPDFSRLNLLGIAFDGMTAERPFDPNGYVLAPGNRLDLDITIPSELRGQEITIEDRFTRQPFPLAIIRVGDTEAVDTPSFAIPAAARIPLWGEALEMPIHTEFILDARRGGEFGVEWLMLDPKTGKVETPVFNRGRFHRLRFTNKSYRLHPMHLHGLFFKVLARNGEPVHEPHWRDTVLVGSQEIIDVGLVPLDLGSWLTHCHIQEHHEAGMMTVFTVE